MSVVFSKKTGINTSSWVFAAIGAPKKTAKTTATAPQSARIGPVGGERISPVHERTDKNDPERFDNTHSGTRDFTIANVDCIGKPYSIRISMLADKKMNSTLIDTEIAGLRTMISNRVNACICSVRAVGQNGAGVGTMSVYTYRMEQCR